MNIGVNYRLASESQSGIPMFIKKLYSLLPKMDVENKYFLLAPDKKSNGIGTIVYDNYSMLDLARKNKLKVLHGPAHTLPILKPKGIKYLLTVHDISFLVLPQMGSWDFKLIYGWWLKRSIQVADHIVTDSDNTRRDLLKRFNISENLVTTVYLGVDPVFKPIKIKKGPKYLFTVATHSKRKNLNLLTRAFISLSKKHDLYLKVVGKLPTEDLNLLSKFGLEAKVSHYDHVPQEELISLYQNATAFVYPSLYEGFGLPVLEAMACGIPAVCSDNSSLPEVQPDSSQRFNQNNLKQLEGIIERLITDKRYEQKICKLNIINSKKFTWDNTAKQYKNIINDLIAL